MIRSLVSGGAAELDGRLHPGHRLMSVNNTNLEHATLDAAVQTLKSTERGTNTYFYHFTYEILSFNNLNFAITFVWPFSLCFYFAHDIHKT